jgi:outer membrane protein assembly factor BamB
MLGRFAYRALLLGILATSWGYADENWPQFRGPDQTGIGAATNLPVTWSETENIAWKTPLPWWSGSSPIVWGDRVYVTSPSRPEGKATEANADFENPGGPKLLLLCLSKQDGKILWERELGDGNALGRKQNFSSPTPVTDGAHLWTITGTGEVTALTMDGDIVWHHNLTTEYGPLAMQFGYACSPLLYDGMIIVQVLHGYKMEATSYVMAYDAVSGAVKWRVERPTTAILEAHDSYNTPTLLRHAGKTQIIVSGGDCVTGHDPDTGKEIWRAWGLNPTNYKYNRIIASPVVAADMIFAPTRQKPMLAIRAGGEGDITATHIAWKWNKPAGPDVPTPACDGAYFYMVDDRGVITVLQPKTGEVVYGPEHTARGTVSASPIVADGKIYITNEDGVTAVLAAGPAFKLIATNTLDGGGHTLSSIAISGNQLFLRTPSSLYCIGVKKP